MNNEYVENAKALFKLGNNCSNSIYQTFEKDYNLKGVIPEPRSIDGICGTILTTRQILKELGKEEYIKDYEEKFINEFKYTKCIELIKYKRRCSDYIGFSVNYINKILK